MDKLQMINEINTMKKEQNAVIVAHFYQEDDVQEIADITGDSFALSRYCANSDFDKIVFCGVEFMAESANILSPEKTVLLPVKRAGCPMADMVTAEALRKEKKKYDDLTVVCYINSTAEVKAESDICCTSSNAIKVVSSLKTKNVLFVPDRNLGSYVKEQIKDKNIILWDGFCVTHDRETKDNLIDMKTKYPYASVLVHPECRKEVRDLADYIGSTKQIIDFAKSDDAKEYIIGTEEGILYELKKQNPDKKFHMMSNQFICINMKKTKLEDVHRALLKNQYIIEVDKEIREKAWHSLDRMLAIK